MEHDPSRRGVDPGSAAQGPPFLKRLTRRTKIFIVADLVILVAALTASLVWVATRQDGPSESAASSAATSTTPLLTTKPTPPLQSAQGIAWITAACGNPTLIQGTGPNTLLARSTDLGICMGTPGAPSVLVGVYEHGSGLDDDLAAMSSAYHHAVRIDDGSVGWIFVTQGDAPTLAGLARYGFRIE